MVTMRNMDRIQDLAIVLRWVPYEERHRVVTALTENHGRISALARNSIQSRRFGGSLEPFAASEWTFVERVGADLYRVEEAQIRRGYEGLRADFAKLSLASVFNELMIRVAPEREPCPELFRLHANALAMVEETPAEALTGHGVLLNAYLAKVLQWSGNQAQVQACFQCHTGLEALKPSDSLTCLVADAAWVCPSCRKAGIEHLQDPESSREFQHRSLRISARAVMDFYQSLVTPIRQVPELARATGSEHEALFLFIQAMMEYHVLGFDPTAFKSLRFLEMK